MGSSRMGLSTFPQAFLVLLPLVVLLSSCSPTPPEECSSVFQPRSMILSSKCNRTELSQKNKEEIQSFTAVLLIPSLYLLAFLIGLPANVIALWILVFRTKRLPATWLLINLTVTDLFLLAVLPFRITSHFYQNDWMFGEPLCRLVTALFYGNMYGSVLCLMLVSVDRYVALVHPFGARTLRSRQSSLCMSAAVWVVILLAMLPLLVLHQSYKISNLNITLCHYALPKEQQENYFFPYFTSMFAICFLLPLLVIVFCYGAVLRTLIASGQRYAHAVRVTILVLLVFIVCFLPSNILLLVHSTNKDHELYLPYMLSVTLSTFNSCVDPFIFYYVSDDFRARVRKTFCCRGVGDQDSSSGNQVSYSSSGKSGKSKSTLVSMSVSTPEHNPVL